MTMYVAYGSNLDIVQMRRRCPECKFVGSGRLEGWRLMFKGEMPFSYATVEEWEGYKVPVAIYSISAEDEKRLDKYEGYPKHYQKREVTVQCEGRNIKGSIYVKPEEERLNPPDSHYYALIYSAYEDLGFDVGILEEALKFSDRLNFGVVTNKR